MQKTDYLPVNPRSNFAKKNDWFSAAKLTINIIKRKLIYNIHRKISLSETTSPKDVLRTSPHDPLCNAKGRFLPTSSGRWNMTPWGRPNVTSWGRPHIVLYVTPRNVPYRRLEEVTYRLYAAVLIWSNR